VALSIAHWLEEEKRKKEKKKRWVIQAEIIKCHCESLIPILCAELVVPAAIQSHLALEVWIVEICNIPGLCVPWSALDEPVSFHLLPGLSLETLQGWYAQERQRLGLVSKEERIL
jgi:hypothetical protein